MTTASHDTGSSAAHVYRGACHCGAIRLTLESRYRPDALPIRACDCGFCTSHGARGTTDPLGHLRIEVGDPATLNRYRFGLCSADFLLCNVCGVYIAAVLLEAGRTLATVNTRTFHDPTVDARPATPVHYGGETLEQRLDRRHSAWTPTDLIVGDFSNR